MSVARFEGVERGPSVAPTKGSADDPTSPYPTVCASGRSGHRFVLLGGRHLRRTQPERKVLCDPQAALGRRSAHPRPRAAASRRRVRAVVLARERSFLCAPVCRHTRASSLLVSSQDAQTTRRFLEPLRRAILPELLGDPETVIVDSTLLEVLHPPQVCQSVGFPRGASWVRWGSFCV